MSTAWKNISRKEYPKFSGHSTVDIVIIGGGMAGIISAYLLAHAGKKVALLEKERLGGGMTEYTTAFITQSIDTDTADLIRLWGTQGARNIMESHRAAIDLIESIVENEKIECEFTRCPNFIYTDTQKDLKILAAEAEALMNLDVDVRLFEKGSGLGFETEGYIEMRNQAKFHPLKFLFALAEKAAAAGAQIFECSEAKCLETLAGGRQRVVVKGGTIEADYAIVATYKPFNNPLSLYFKKGSYASYVVEYEVQGMKLVPGTYEDTDNPYHYFRVDPLAKGFRVIAGGEDHREDIPVSEEKSFAALMEYMDTIIPPEKKKIVRKWSGQILEPVDGLPSIGLINEDHVLYALGFSGNGMTYSALAAKIFRDIITGEDNAWIPLYHPRRHMGIKRLAAKARDYGEELVRGALKNTFTRKKEKKPKK